MRRKFRILTDDLDELLDRVDAVIATQTAQSLNASQKLILRECCRNEKKTYDRIAEEYNYSASYLKKKAAPWLWHLLSEAFGEKVTKGNCRYVLHKHLRPERASSLSATAVSLESPEGQVPLVSPFYIDRPPLEQSCYAEIEQPGALLRIKAPRKLGKTSLMARVLAFAREQGDRVVRLSLNRASHDVFSSTDKFLRWFCASATQQLDIESQLDEYWDEDLGSLMNCTLYFQGYLLVRDNRPLVVALDEVNQLFEYPAIARDFFAMLRSWHEDTKDLSAWKKLRLVLVNSTDIYIPLDTNKSPFNVGVALDLRPFTPPQVQNLALRHDIDLSPEELDRAMELLGGFPYLVRLFLYRLARDRQQLSALLDAAATDTGIFSTHLHEQLGHLQQNAELAAAYSQIVRSPTPLQLEQKVAFKLRSLGLVNLDGNQVTLSCELYRQYFRDRL